MNNKTLKNPLKKVLKNSRKGIFITLAVSTLLATSCKKKGCMDPTANNYSEKAKKDNGSCDYTPVTYTLGDVTSNYTFTDNNIKICEPITVSAGLIIPEGTNITICAGGSIDITSTGYIQAIGTATKPIVIKGETETSGYWEGIKIASNNPNNIFDHVTVKDAGSYWYWEYANVYVADGAKLSVSNSTFSNSENIGLFIEGNASLSTFENNTFANNITGLNIGLKQLGKIDGASNYNSSNSNDFIFVRDGTITSQATWPKTTTPILLNDCNLEAAVTITAGANILVEADGEIDVRSTGSLTAIGTASEPINIKGRYTTAGFWNGIKIGSNNPNNKLAYTNIADGGKYWYWEYANIYVNSGSGNLTIDNCTISNANSYGIYVENSTTIITSGTTQTTAAGVEANNTFTGNGTGPDADCTTGCTIYFE